MKRVGHYRFYIGSRWDKKIQVKLEVNRKKERPIKVDGGFLPEAVIDNLSSGGEQARTTLRASGRKSFNSEKLQLHNLNIHQQQQFSSYYSQDEGQAFQEVP